MDEIVIKMAQDIGFIRGVIEPIAEADLPARMTFIEGQQKVQNDRIRTMEERRANLVRTGFRVVMAAAAIGSAVAGFLFH